MTRPVSLSLGAYLMASGGAIVIAVMAAQLDFSEGGLLGYAAYYLLTAVCFLAVAGGFRKGGQWPIEVIIVMMFACIGLSTVGWILSIYPIQLTIAMIVQTLVALATVLGCASAPVWFGTLE